MVRAVPVVLLVLVAGVGGVAWAAAGWQPGCTDGLMPTADEGATSQPLRLRLHVEGREAPLVVCVVDGAGRLVHEQRVDLPPGQEEVLDLRVPVGADLRILVRGSSARWSTSLPAGCAEVLEVDLEGTYQGVDDWGFMQRAARCVRDPGDFSASGAQASVVGGLEALRAGPWVALAVGGGSLVLASWWLLRRLRGGGAAMLFSRIHRSRVLDHPLRRRIRDLVASEPGIHPARLMRVLGIADGQVRHHVGVLLREGFVSETRVGGRRHLFPARWDGAVGLQGAALLQRPAVRRVYEAVRDRGTATLDEIARDAGVSRSYASRIVRRLCEAGVTCRRAGTPVRVFVA